MSHHRQQRPRWWHNNRRRAVFWLLSFCCPAWLCFYTAQAWVLVAAPPPISVVWTTTSGTGGDCDSVATTNHNNGTSSIPTVFTSAVLCVSYDGTRFTGWSSSGDDRHDDDDDDDDATSSNSKAIPAPTRLTATRRNRHHRGEPTGELVAPQGKKGFVRSVEGVLRTNLAKIYGNVDPNRIVVEGCSRTDRGVHATSMMAHIYCLTQEAAEATAVATPTKTGETNTATGPNSVIAGKRNPHPTSPTDDSFFEPIPMNGNLARLAFALNRMRPADLQVTGIAPTPRLDRDGPPQVFHVSTSSLCKTYEYRISTGPVYDPIRRRMVWNISRNSLDLDAMKEACSILQGRHDFVAFQGAPRGADEKQRRIRQQEVQQRIQNGSEEVSGGTTCCLHKIQIITEERPMEDYFEGVYPPLQEYRIVVQGDRFLYKMVRFLVGSIVAVGRGSLQVDDVQRALTQGNWDIPNDLHGRRHQFECAPAHGLVLTHVDYGCDIAFDWQPLRDTGGQR